MAGSPFTGAARPWNVQSDANILENKSKRLTAQAKPRVLAALADVDAADRPRIARWLAHIGLIDLAAYGYMVRPRLAVAS